MLSVCVVFIQLGHCRFVMLTVDLMGLTVDVLPHNFMLESSSPCVIILIRKS